MFFSIIIPTYNSSLTIERAIKSILNQHFIDYEILIVDGKSSDDTLIKLEQFQDNRIKVFSEKDNGIYDAMNKGINHSKGEWLYFLGSDDYLIDNLVFQDVRNRILTEKNLDILYGDVFSSRFGGIYGGEFDLNRLFKRNICHQAIFFKRHVFFDLSMFDCRYKGHADWHHNIIWMSSKHIKKEYFNRTIAEYSDGGYSSKMGDPEFAKIKSLHFLKNLKSGQNDILFISIFKREIRKAVNEKAALYFIKVMIIFTLNQIKNKLYR